MRYRCLAASLAALVLLDPTASAAEKIQLKVLYAGKPNDTRTKDFVSFLQQHFVRVGEVDYEKFKADEAKDFDVVLFDWPSIYPRDKDGKIAPKITSMNSPHVPRLSTDFDRPAVLIGAAGGDLAGPRRLKIDWL